MQPLPRRRAMPRPAKNTEKSKHPDRALVRFLHRRQENLERDPSAALMHAFNRSPGRGAAPWRAYNPFKSGPMQRPVFLRDHQIDLPVQGVFRRMAEEALGAGVPRADGAVGARVDDRGIAVARKRRAKRSEIPRARHDRPLAGGRPSAAGETFASVGALSPACGHEKRRLCRAIRSDPCVRSATDIEPAHARRSAVQQRRRSPDALATHELQPRRIIYVAGLLTPYLRAALIPKRHRPKAANRDFVKCSATGSMRGSSFWKLEHPRDEYGRQERDEQLGGRLFRTTGSGYGAELAFARRRFRHPRRRGFTMKGTASNTKTTAPAPETRT